MPPGHVFSSAELHDRMGAWLDRNIEGRGILRSAHEAGVPVFVPAFTDSELGLDLSTWAMRQARTNGDDPLKAFEAIPRYNPYLDLNSFARFAMGAERLGIFTIGGGVPRNWAQEVGPYIDITNHRLGLELRPQPRYHYAVRICPEPDHWGGLSGCSYTEGVSWGKFVPETEGGRFAEVYSDATIAWPLVVRAVMERLDR